MARRKSRKSDAIARIEDTKKELGAQA